MKKIATVSVLAIMAVSAARADIASTTYVDKAKAAVEGQVTELSGVVATKAAAADVTALAGRVTTAESGISTNATEIAKKAAQADVNTLTDKVGDVSLSGTNYMKTDTNLTAAVKSLDTQLSNVAGGNVDVNKIVAGSIAKAKLTQTLQDEISNATQGVSDNAGEITTIKNTMATDTELKAVSDNLANNYSTTEQMNAAIGKGTLTVTIDGANAGTFNANAADNGTIEIEVPSTYVNETELGTALEPYAKSADVATTYATKTALTEGLAEKVNTADVANLSVSHAETAGSATTAAGYTTGGAIAQALDGKVDDNEISDMATKTYVGEQLGSYSTTAQMNTELDKKQDKTTAVTHTANTAVGDATHAVYIDSTGAAKVVDKVAAAAAADSATKATQDASGNVITTTYATKTEVNTLTDGLGSLADVQIPDLPGECKGDDATADCTLVIAVGADNALTAKWEKVAR